MEFDTFTKLKHSRLKVKVSRRDKSPEPFAQDVLKGLSSNPKTLPPKYFYDETGSELFEEITSLPEYYPTRTEDELLARSASDIIARVEPAQIIEFGSGTARGFFAAQ